MTGHDTALADAAFDAVSAVARHGRLALLCLVLLVALATGGAAADGIVEPMGGGSGDTGP